MLIEFLIFFTAYSCEFMCEKSFTLCMYIATFVDYKKRLKWWNQTKKKFIWIFTQNVDQIEYHLTDGFKIHMVERVQNSYGKKSFNHYDKPSSSWLCGMNRSRQISMVAHLHNSLYSKLVSLQYFIDMVWAMLMKRYLNYM